MWWNNGGGNKRPGRSVPVLAGLVSVLACLGGLWWTAAETPQMQGASDKADVMSFAPGMLGAVVGAWGLWAALRALRAQRTASVIAGELALAVARGEGAQYRQLLGSGSAAPTGRIDLAFTAAAIGVDGVEQEGRLEEVTDYYRRLAPGRVIITGTPSGGRGGDEGTGKTVLALALLLGLAKDRTPQDPVAVRLTAASWPGGSIRAWLRTYLVETYRLTGADAGRLVEAGLVLPVIDGLDEMDTDTAPVYTSRTAQFLRRIDEFENGGTHCPVVLTCRYAQYERLVEAEAEPRVVAHVAVARVDAGRAAQYLQDRVASTERARARWQPVLSALTEAAEGSAQPVHRAVAATLDTPWRLTLAATVFEQRTADGRYLRDPEELLALATEGHLYAYLLERFIPASVSAPPIEGRHDPGTGIRRRQKADRTWKYLAALARYLEQNNTSPRAIGARTLSSTDLILHELWPLAGQHRIRWTERVVLTALLLPYVLFMLTHSPLMKPPFERDEEFYFYLFTTAALAGFWGLGVTVRRSWPRPKRIGLDGSERWFLVTGALLSIVAGGILHLVLENEVGLTASLGLYIALALVFTTGREKYGAAPGSLVRRDLVAGTLPGMASAVTIVLGWVGMGAIDASETFDELLVWVGNCVIFALPVAIGMVGLPIGGGSAALRYGVFLLHTRRRLPWRLGRFLDDCYQLGILRVAGTAWQFRHRELQDYLAHHPHPEHPMNTGTWRSRIPGPTRARQTTSTQSADR